jgi:2-desacetyl-2-hydroxyethyl bacteriochlorophyllide A dehydrogenase
MTVMQALVVDAPGRFALREVPCPEPQRGEVMLRVRHCGVCGTDLGIIAGRYPVPSLPLVIGHEIAGEIVATGQAAVVDGIKSCGACRHCRRGCAALCEAASELGIHEAGGLAEYVVAPARNVHPLPAGMSTLEGALVEPLACAMHGQERVGIELGDTVAVIGGGTQGLLHTALAGLRGAAGVVVSARHERRCRLAAAAGADLVVDPDHGDTDEGFADVVIEASGSATGCADAARMVRRGGRILLYGAAPADAPVPATAFEVFEKELAIVGSFGAAAGNWPRAIDLIHTGRIDAEGLVDAVWPLERAAEGLAELAKDRGMSKGVIRVRD